MAESVVSVQNLGFIRVDTYFSHASYIIVRQPVEQMDMTER